MRAWAAEAAFAEVGAEFREGLIEAVGVHTPETDLAQPRRVDHVAAAVEADETGGDGCVASLVHGLADRADAQGESGLDRVQQARLAHAGRPGDHALVTAQQLAEAVDVDVLRG